MKKIVISTSTFDISHNPHTQHLLSNDWQIISNPYKRKLTEAEAAELLEDGVVGMIAGIEPLTAFVLESAKDLKVISRCGTGMDSVDLDAAKELGITVFNTPVAPAEAVAELTLGFILSLLRQTCQIDQAVRNGQWPRTQGRLLAAQTVGLIGLGHIGQRVAKLCQAFGANVIAHDPYIEKSPDNVTLVSFDELLATADIISLHVPYSSKLHHLLDKNAFRAMKPGAIVINAARGGLVDEQALLAALNSEHLKAAALDVFEQEPYRGPLLECDNIILTSHIGSLAKEARQNMEIEAAENLLQGLTKTGLIK